MTDREIASGAGSNRQRTPERRGGVEVRASLVGACVALVAMLLLAALVTTAIGPLEPSLPPAPPDDASQSESSFWISGWIGSVIMLIVSFLAGGYVAARVARHHQPANGVAAAGWAAAVIVVFAIVGALAGSDYDLFARLNLPSWGEQFGANFIETVLAVLIWLAVMLSSGWLGGALGSKAAPTPPEVA